jgi:hypothetical protein
MAWPGAGFENPAFQSYLEERMSALDQCAVAEVASVGGNEDALAVLRVRLTA